MKKTYSSGLRVQRLIQRRRCLAKLNLLDKHVGLIGWALFFEVLDLVNLQRFLIIVEEKSITFSKLV